MNVSEIYRKTSGQNNWKKSVSDNFCMHSREKNICVLNSMYGSSYYRSLVACALSCWNFDLIF